MHPCHVRHESLQSHGPSDVFVVGQVGKVRAMINRDQSYSLPSNLVETVHAPIGHRFSLGGYNLIKARVVALPVFGLNLAHTSY